VKKRLPLLIALGGSIVVWKAGLFGFFPTERTVIWRFPISYADVRRVEFQVWQHGELLKREERLFPQGATGEMSCQVPLGSGTHQAIALVTLHNRPTANSFRLEFEPDNEDTVVIDFAAK
jgi:hypothetical protein